MVGSVDSESLNQLRDTLERHPRMHGYYLLNFEPLPLGWRGNEETSLTKAFEALDDQTWKPAELCSEDQHWVDYEVDEARARAHAVEALVGGGAVGHTRETVPERDSSAIWKQFRDLFSRDARFFIGLGLGDPAYAYQHGAIVVDNEKAGCLCVVEGD